MTFARPLTLLPGRLRFCGWRGSAWHIGAVILLACIGLQSLLLPAQRAAGGLHFHVAAHFSDLDAAFAGLDRERGEHHAQNVDEPAGEPHDHAHTARHSHADERSDVVYVEADDAELASPADQGLKRGALDHDGLWPSASSLTPTAVAAIPPRGARPPSYRSQVPPLLERPPRGRAD